MSTILYPEALDAALAIQNTPGRELVPHTWGRRLLAVVGRPFLIDVRAPVAKTFILRRVPEGSSVREGERLTLGADGLMRYTPTEPGYVRIEHHLGGGYAAALELFAVMPTHLRALQHFDRDGDVFAAVQCLINDPRATTASLTWALEEVFTERCPRFFGPRGDLPLHQFSLLGAIDPNPNKAA
jgi:hypothetical protein